MQTLDPKGINDLQKCLRGVVAKVKHHATHVESTVLALVGPALLYKDADSDLEVLVRDGDFKNLIAARFGGGRFVFSYNPRQEDDRRETRDGSRTSRAESR